MQNKNETSLPGFTAASSLYNLRIGYQQALHYGGAKINLIVPQDCGIFKKIGCATAVAACGTVCLTGAGIPACAACFASLGASGCIDCL
jgi:hypothetical protein